MASHQGHLAVMKLLLSMSASVYDRTTTDGKNCLAVAKTQEAKHLLENWVVTMLLIVLRELFALPSLDPSSFIDLRKFIEL